jgi:hypothetical protein
MELRAVTPTAQEELRLFNDQLFEFTTTSAPVASTPAFGPPTASLNGPAPARHGRPFGRLPQPESWGSDPAAMCRPLLKKEGSVRALTLPVELVDRGDVVAIGQRFYCVDSVVQTHARLEFPLIVLRSIETAARAAIEFRNAEALISVLRLPSRPWWTGENRLTQQAPSGGS